MYKLLKHLTLDEYKSCVHGNQQFVNYFEEIYKNEVDRYFMVAKRSEIFHVVVTEYTKDRYWLYEDLNAKEIIKGYLSSYIVHTMFCRTNFHPIPTVIFKLYINDKKKDISKSEADYITYNTLKELNKDIFIFKGNENGDIVYTLLNKELYTEDGKIVPPKKRLCSSNLKSYNIPVFGCVAHGFDNCISNCKHFIFKKEEGNNCGFCCPKENKLSDCNDICEYYYLFSDSIKHSCTYEDDNLCNIVGYDIYEKNKKRK